MKGVFDKKYGGDKGVLKFESGEGSERYLLVCSKQFLFFCTNASSEEWEG